MLLRHGRLLDLSQIAATVSGLFEIEAIAQNIVVLTTFWLNFQQIKPVTGTKQDIDIGRGIYQVMVLLAPYLKAAERAHLNKLADQYLNPQM